MFLVNWIFAVRRRSPGDVSDWEPETLLHCDEKTRPKEASESDQATSEPISCPLLRYITLPTLWDCHFRPHLLEHGLDGDRALRPESSGHLLPRDLQCPLHHHLQSGWDSTRLFAIQKQHEKCTSILENIIQEFREVLKRWKYGLLLIWFKPTCSLQLCNTHLQSTE